MLEQQKIIHSSYFNANFLEGLEKMYIHSTSNYFAPSETTTAYLFCIPPYPHYFSRNRTFFAIRVFLLIICKELENRLHFLPILWQWKLKRRINRWFVEGIFDPP